MKDSFLPDDIIGEWAPDAEGVFRLVAGEPVCHDFGDLVPGKRYVKGPARVLLLVGKTEEGCAVEGQHIWTAGYQRSVIARLKTDSADVAIRECERAAWRAAETNHIPHEAEWQIAWARLNKGYTEVVAGVTS